MLIDRKTGNVVSEAICIESELHESSRYYVREFNPKIMSTFCFNPFLIKFRLHNLLRSAYEIVNKGFITIGVTSNKLGISEKSDAANIKIHRQTLKRSQKVRQCDILSNKGVLKALREFMAEAKKLDSQSTEYLLGIMKKLNNTK